MNLRLSKVHRLVNDSKRFAEMLQAFDRLSEMERAEIREAAITICGDGAATEDQVDAAHFIATKLWPEM